jgi:uncharacterized membrane protein YgcG
VIWILPFVVMARSIRQKDRLVLAAGAIATLTTLLTNKPYFGWKQNTWDPMVLGAMLIALALFLRRWLSEGPSEIRHGFTARRLSGKDKEWLNTGTSVAGLTPAGDIAPGAQTAGSDFHFGGGDFGGGGANSDF